MSQLKKIVSSACCACVVTLAAACGGKDGGGAGAGAAGMNAAGTGAAGLDAAGTGAAAGGGAAGTGASVGTAGGEVSEAYSGYCVATFTKSYDVIDVFGDTELSIASGAKYLLADLGTFTNEVHILYLSAAGPVEFAIGPDDNGDLPFTSSCAEGSATQSYIGAFTDVTVYSDAALTTVICMLNKDTVEKNASFGFELVSDIFAEPSIYRVEFEVLATLCNGATTGYIAAPSATVAGTQQAVIPIASFIGPI